MKKLISTGYAAEKKKFIYKPMRNLFDEDDTPQLDESKDFSHGRIYRLDADDLAKVDYPLYALKHWQYLDGDGDFRSAEVTALRDEADVIITNPPFSKFREFLAWILDVDKKFLIIGNKNCITYKEVFPLIMANQIWAGSRPWAGGMWFFSANTDCVDKVVDGNNLKNSPSIWLTNLEHIRRHEPLRLNTLEENIQLHPKIRGVGFSNGLWHADSLFKQATINGRKVYTRIFIRRRQP